MSVKDKKSKKTLENVLERTEGGRKWDWQQLWRGRNEWGVWDSQGWKEWEGESAEGEKKSEAAESFLSLRFSWAFPPLEKLYLSLLTPFFFISSFHSSVLLTLLEFETFPSFLCTPSPYFCSSFDGLYVTSLVFFTLFSPRMHLFKACFTKTVPSCF